MNAVNVENRAFCLAMMSVLLHTLGDVPSPIMAGYLKDELAPSCNGVDASSDECRADNEGLRLTMLLITLWLGWCILFFSLARYIASNDKLRNDGTSLRTSRDYGLGGGRNGSVSGNTGNERGGSISSSRHSMTSDDPVTPSRLNSTGGGKSKGIKKGGSAIVEQFNL